MRPQRDRPRRIRRTLALVQAFGQEIAADRKRM